MLQYATENWESIVAIIGGVVTIANVVTAMTPTTSDDKVLNAVLKILNVLSINVGKNRNADDVPVEPK